MTPLEELETRTPRYVLIGAAVMIVAGCVLGAYSCHKSHQKAAAVAVADQSHQAAAVERAAAGALDGAEKNLAAQTQRAALVVQTRAQQVATARADLAKVWQDAPKSPGAPPVQPAPTPADLEDVVAKQDALIKAQDGQIQALTAQVQSQASEIHTLTLSRDTWKASAGDSAQEALQLRAALLAQEGVLAAAKLKYGLGGLLVGFGAGRASR